MALSGRDVLITDVGGSGRKPSPRCEPQAPSSLPSILELPDKDAYRTTGSTTPIIYAKFSVIEKPRPKALQVPKNNYKHCQPQIPTLRRVQKIFRTFH